MPSYIGDKIHLEHVIKSDCFFKGALFFIANLEGFFFKFACSLFVVVLNIVSERTGGSFLYFHGPFLTGDIPMYKILENRLWLTNQFKLKICIWIKILEFESAHRFRCLH